jgi:hypothetical protein
LKIRSLLLLALHSNTIKFLFTLLWGFSFVRNNIINPDYSYNKDYMSTSLYEYLL